MARVLIAYGTIEGQIAKIAHHVADAGRELGHVVKTLVTHLTHPRSTRLVCRSTADLEVGNLRLKHFGDAVHATEPAHVSSSDEYPGFILGASLYKRRHPRDIAAPVKRKSAWRNARPSEFFSVSLGAAGSAAHEIERVMHAFLEQND